MRIFLQLEIVKTARKVKDYLLNVDTAVKYHSGNCVTKLLRVKTIPLQFLFKTKCYEEYSKGPWLSKIAVRSIIGTSSPKFLTLDVSVTCNCPYFRYWGPYYNNKIKGNLAPGDPPKEFKYLPPVVRDPEGKKFLCKHLVNSINMLKDRKVDVYEGIKDRKDLKRPQDFPTTAPTPSGQAPTSYGQGFELLKPPAAPPASAVPPKPGGKPTTPAVPNPKLPATPKGAVPSKPDIPKGIPSNQINKRPNIMKKKIGV